MTPEKKGHTLATGNPNTGQSDSVVESANPHGDTKLSSSKGMTQEREKEDLAEGKPPSKK